MGIYHSHQLRILPEQAIKQGQKIATIGTPTENGGWPPHLYFQIIKDLQGYSGDYPGVCTGETQEAFLLNCPDPNLILKF